MSSDDKGIGKARKDLPAEHSILREMSIDDLDISVRTYNCLVSAGVKNVEDLAQMSDAEIAGLQGVTPGDLNEIKRLRFTLGCSAEAPRLEGFELLDSLINHSSECSKAEELPSTEQPV